jgi:hypothetical protein
MSSNFLLKKYINGYFFRLSLLLLSLNTLPLLKGSSTPIKIPAIRIILIDYIYLMKSSAGVPFVSPQNKPNSQKNKRRNCAKKIT